MTEPVNPESLGVGRVTAYALAILKIEVVSRRTLRALLPEGKSRERSEESIAKRRERGLTGTAARCRDNTMTEKLREALKKFESRGWIERDAEYVKVYNYQALLEHALQANQSKSNQLFKSMVPAQLLSLDAALADIKVSILELTKTDLIEQARRERAAIERLMRASVDPRDKVRQVPIKRTW